jgi:hypothetical protein
MNLKTFRLLQQENPHAAMIFDLSERFPRGPKGKLRKKHYRRADTWSDTWVSDELLGGELGYDIFELYKVAKAGIGTWELADLSTTIEAAGMGYHQYMPSADGTERVFVSRKLFKAGAQSTRRLNRLNERFTQVRKMVAEKSKKNLYNIRIGHESNEVVVFGDSEQHARMQYEMMLKAGFDAGTRAGFINAGWGECDEAPIRVVYRGPSHGVHEIMAANQEYSKGIDDAVSKMELQIKQLQGKIAAARDIQQMVDMFTLQSCAAAAE